MRGIVKKMWSIKKSGEVFNKLKHKGVIASCLSIYKLYTIFTTQTQNLY